MKMRLEVIVKSRCMLLLMGVMALAATTADAQFMPVGAKMRRTVDTTNPNTGVKTHIDDVGAFYRTSDGSRILHWTTHNGIEADTQGVRSTLWDNKTGTSYVLDYANKRATFHGYGAPESAQLDSRFVKEIEQFPEATVSGVRCNTQPASFVGWEKGRAETPVGTSCFSTDYNLTLKQDWTYPSRDGKLVVHLVFELYDIHIGEEPDPALFDLHNFQVLKPQNQN